MYVPLWGWINGSPQMLHSQIIQSTARYYDDGLANAGITDIEELSHHARELASMGVSTSTFGVGNDFNEHLLESMANMGQGNFFFIESPKYIPNIFASEFKELSAITARDIELKLELPAEQPMKYLEGMKKSRKRKSGGSNWQMYSGKSQWSLPGYFPAQQDAKDWFEGSDLCRGESGELLEAR
jgi:hypothetical protein